MAERSHPSLRTRLVGGFVRRLGLMRRAMTLGVRAVVVDADDRVLLVRHTYVAGWYLPGGGVERGETMLTSLERELEEEAGVRLTGAPELFGIYLNLGRDHVALYVARAFDHAPKPPDNEIAEAGFFALDALPADATRATRARLDEVFRGAPVSPRW